MNNYQKLQVAHVAGRFPQAVLFVGPLYASIADCAHRLIQMLLCQNKGNNPCLECNDCLMVARQEHPDIQWIKSEKSGGTIKIDQIRELQHTAYLTPQRAPRRVIVIDAADRMNTASANALLKILEEPAHHTVFILIAQQLSTVLPTILSRCQLFRFASLTESYCHNLLLLGEQYQEESEQAVIIKHAELILSGLIALIERKVHPCVLASQWAKFEMSTFLWFYYLVFAQLQHMQCTASVPSGLANEQLCQLSSLLNSALIFSQLDKINSLLKKLSHNINVNQVLALEDLLFDLMGGI